jgi:hypothetical protein
LQTEFVAAVTSVRRELDEVTATLLGITAMSGYGTVLPIWNVSAIIAIGDKKLPRRGTFASRTLWGKFGKRGGARSNTSWRCLEMRRTAIGRPSATLLVAAGLGLGLGLGVATAHAGPCSSKIAQFEQAVRQSAGNPNAGPMAPQSIGAQLDVQPTPASVRRAEQKAQAAFAATLARAKRLDAQGHRAGCTRALAAAKRMYNLR